MTRFSWGAALLRTHNLFQLRDVRATKKKAVIVCVTLSLENSQDKRPGWREQEWLLSHFASLHAMPCGTGTYEKVRWLLGNKKLQVIHKDPAISQCKFLYKSS